MQNQVHIDAQLAKPHGDRSSVYVNDEKTFASANLLIVSVDSEGRSTRAYLDAVAFNGKTGLLEHLSPGEPFTVIGRLESTKRENGWKLRLLVDGVQKQQLDLTEEAR